MSLLLLFGGAQVASDDRNFTATWEQVAATWSATMVGPGVSPQPIPPSAGYPELPRLPEIQILTLRGTFEQKPAIWSATMEVDNDPDDLEELLRLGAL